MAYTNQTTTDMADFISKLDIFIDAVANWDTTLDAVKGEWAARKTPSGIDIAMATQYLPSTPNFLGIYQWHGAVYNAGVDPWAQNDDSGNGEETQTITLNGRQAQISDAPIQFWAFEDNHYLHVVVQRTAIEFVHFGCGILDKFGDGLWTGGEYVYGHWQDVNTGASQALDVDSTMLLDGLSDDSATFNNQEERVATLHVEGLDDQPASGMYAVCMGDQNSARLGNDRQSSPIARIHVLGGFRAGPIAYPFTQFRATLGKANVPMYPIVCHHWDRTTGDVYPLGQMKDVRGVNNRDFAAGQEITEDSDIWIVFPSARKATIDSQTGAGYSQYQGIAYKKVTS